MGGPLPSSPSAGDPTTSPLASSPDEVETRPPDFDLTVVEAARALGDVGREILHPVESILGEQATRVERVRTLVGGLNSGTLRLIISLEGLAALVVTLAVFFVGIADAWLFVLMEALVGVAVLRYVRATVEGMRWRRLARALSAAMLSLLWAWILVYRVPAEPLWGSPDLSQRAELPVLWFAVGAHAFIGILLLVHLPFRSRAAH